MSIIKLGNKEFTVGEMAIGRRKFLVPAIRTFYRDLNKKPIETRFELDEKEYDALIEIALKATFPQITKDELLSITVTESELLNASFAIADLCGLKAAEKGDDTGEASGEKTAPLSPTTTE